MWGNVATVRGVPGHDAGPAELADESSANTNSDALWAETEFDRCVLIEIDWVVSASNARVDGPDDPALSKTEPHRRTRSAAESEPRNGICGWDSKYNPGLRRGAI